VIGVLVLALLPGARAGSVEFDLRRIQFHVDDVVTIEGRATPNSTVMVTLYRAQEELYRNYSTSNAAGAWAHGLRIDASWGFGTRTLYAKDMNTSNEWHEELEVVERPGDVELAMERAIAAAWLWAVSIVALVVVLSIAALLTGLGYAAFLVRRLTLRQAWGRLGAALEVWINRTWWQLFQFLKQDDNYLRDETSGMLAMGMRRALRFKKKAERDKVLHQQGLEKAEEDIRDADNIIAKNTVLYEGADGGN
jgi:hypothetical protein